MRLQSETLGQLLERSMITIGSGMLTRQALRLARSQHVHHLPVVDGSTVLGLVCTCDLTGAPPNSRVDDWMSQPPVMLDASASSEEAAQAMKEHGVGSVIVTYDDTAFGIVTRENLLEARSEVESSLGLARCELDRRAELPDS